MKYNKDNCPFCNGNENREIIARSVHAFAIFDKYPVNNGHALIIPNRHCGDYFDLTEEEQAECFRLLNEVKLILEKDFKPEGFNVGINVGEVAGQTVPHVHIHLIPRYAGDVERPLGGVRGVIPHKKEY